MEKINCSGLSDSRSAYAAGELIRQRGGQWLIVTPTLRSAADFAGDLSFFVNLPIHLLAVREEWKLGYEAKNRDDQTCWIRILSALAGGEDCVVVAPAASAIKSLPPKALWKSKTLRLRQGGEMDPADAKAALVAMGYERVPLVYAPGQFALRGDVMDIFSPTEELPLRIEWFDTEIETLRTFDPQSQRTVDQRERAEVGSAELVILDEVAKKRGEERIRENYQKNPERLEQLLDGVARRVNLQELEYYLDYFYDEPEHLWDYLEPTGKIIIEDPNRSRESIETLEKEWAEDASVYLEKGEMVPEDASGLPGYSDLQKLYDAPHDCWFFTPLAGRIRGVDRLTHMESKVGRQTLSYNGKMDLLRRDLNRYVEQAYKVFLVCSGEERRKNLEEFLREIELAGRVWIKEGQLSTGMEWPAEKVCYITDEDIFGRGKKKSLRRRKGRSGQAIAHFSDIDPGDYVVHESHGIGRYEGMETMTVAGEARDYLKVRYAGNDILYVPADQMELIQKYVGGDGRAPKINRLAGSDWRQTKAKARASVASMARELLETSAARTAANGHAFGPDTVWQREFEEAFPYEETEDQLRCIQEIKADMERPQSMDRLLCGDVGYGKTEVAARAMFKCAAEGKQVVMLVPTTVLANQHYHNLAGRFEPYPFRMEVVSRFRSEEEQRSVIADAKRGQVDILIGTHRLLSSDVGFQDLGLLIIDEEQRFGVAHKEKIKSLKKNVDVLTLSATPIPRTLHMSLLGLRDMSLIEEPPGERYPVQTYVMEESDDVIREAIRRELDRGGQVYVVHNRVREIGRIARHIEELVPGQRIAVCHGQMSEQALEDAMVTFMEGEADILVATTIIENGIDIPNVNTLLVMDADRFGLSQLYQLRGRVGRSSRLAYAYLMHRPGKVLTEVATKRLKSIRDFTEFGAGFKIAMRDLEIRGAGNLLGREQHGHMINVGYELYCKMVDDAVRALQGEIVGDMREETTVDVKFPASIPDRYVDDTSVKLSMYQRIAAVQSGEEQTEVLEELADRFGTVPEETRNLIWVARIRAIAQSRGIRKVTVEKKKLILQFDRSIQTRPQALYLDGSGHPLEEAHEILATMPDQS